MILINNIVFYLYFMNILQHQKILQNQYNHIISSIFSLFNSLYKIKTNNFNSVYFPLIKL